MMVQLIPIGTAMIMKVSSAASTYSPMITTIKRQTPTINIWNVSDVNPCRHRIHGVVSVNCAAPHRTIGRTGSTCNQTERPLRRIAARRADRENQTMITVMLPLNS